MPGINDPGTGPLLGFPPGSAGRGGGGGGATVWQSYPWTRVTGGGGGVGAQLSGLGGIDFNALLNMMKRAKQTPKLPQLAGRDLHGDYMQSMRDTDELARIQAMTRPGPTKMTYVGNSPGFLELDPFAMNAYQRQAFLPQGANFFGPTGNEQAGMLRKEDRAALFNQPLWGLQQWAAANQLMNSADQSPAPQQPPRGRSSLR